MIYNRNFFKIYIVYLKVSSILQDNRKSTSLKSGYQHLQSHTSSLFIFFPSFFIKKRKNMSENKMIMLSNGMLYTPFHANNVRLPKTVETAVLTSPPRRQRACLQIRPMHAPFHHSFYIFHQEVINMHFILAC